MSARNLATLLAGAIVVVACQSDALPAAGSASTQSPAASTTPDVTSEPSPTASTTDSPAASAAPTQTEGATATLTYGDEVRVTDHGSGLAVRGSPFTYVGIVAGFTRADETSGTWVPGAAEVRLGAGDTVRLGLGPLCVAERCWYEVFNADPLVGWDADHNGQPEEIGRGWVASGDADGDYLEFSAEGVTEVVSASGRSSQAPIGFRIDQDGIGIAVIWAMATDGLAPCDLVVKLHPDGQTMLTESLIGAFQEGSTLTSMVDQGAHDLEVSASVTGAPDAVCPWAIALRQTSPGYVP